MENEMEKDFLLKKNLHSLCDYISLKQQLRYYRRRYTSHTPNAKLRKTAFVILGNKISQLSQYVCAD